MKIFVVAAIPAVLLCTAQPLLAQGGQAADERLDAALARARSQGVPVSLLESKIAEGRAKGVPTDRIATAVERREAALERAAQALRGQQQVADADLSVSADALEVGVSEAVLKSVADEAPRNRRAVAIAALTALVERGTTPDAALARVREALKRGPDALVALGSDAGRSGNGNGSRGNSGNAGNQGSGRAASPGPPASVPAPGGSSQPRRPETPGNSGASSGRGTGRGR